MRQELFGTLVNNTEYELISAVVNTGNELALIEHWKPGRQLIWRQNSKMDVFI